MEKRKPKDIFINYGMDDIDVIVSPGKCSVKQYTVNNEGDLAIEGSLELKEYIEEIKSIGFEWNNKVVVICNVDVKEEAFGSEDEVVIYNFTSDADSIKVVNGIERRKK